MKKIKLILLLSVAFFQLLGGCRHKQEKTQVIYIDKEMREHFAFKKGSYWIYKDSVSGRVDSCYVQDRDSGFYSTGGATVGQYIRCSIPQKSTDLTNDSALFYVGLQASTLNISYFIKDDMSGIINLPIAYPIKVGRLGAAFDSAVITRIISNYPVAGQDYENVAECYQAVRNDPDGSTFLYFNDSIGIIKVSINIDGLNRIWELQRCHILK